MLENIWFEEERKKVNIQGKSKYDCNNKVLVEKKNIDDSSKGVKTGIFIWMSEWSMPLVDDTVRCCTKKYNSNIEEH